MSSKSCTTYIISFTDSVVLSINDCKVWSTDIIYFNFSKAFDSVNHDIILHKLKNLYGIDGRMLKFLVNYLCGRQQCVIIENVTSTPKKFCQVSPKAQFWVPSFLFCLLIIWQKVSIVILIIGPLCWWHKNMAQNYEWKKSY